MKTILYVSRSTRLLLEQTDVTLWFPESRRHPIELAKCADEILGHVVATHSEPLLNLIGHKIADGSVNHEVFEVRILWEDGTVQLAKYDRHGYLQNWSLGFFNFLSL